MMPTGNQASGVADRIFLMLLTYAAAKGWISSDDIAPYLGLLVGIGGAVYGFWANRTRGVLQKAESLDEVKKVELKPTVENTAMAESLGPKVNITEGTH